MTTDDALLFDARLQHIIEQSLQAMTTEDRAIRVTYCEQTGQHGVRCEVDDDGTVRLSWGGRPLAVLEPDVLDGTTYFEPLEGTRFTLPDSPEALE